MVKGCDLLRISDSTGKVIVIPDSFKGSITAKEAADILGEEIEKHTDFTCIKLPIADGGEGSVDCVLASLGGHKKYVKVLSPEFKEIDAYYGITEDGLAVIEIAESSGITKQTSFCTAQTTTYGFGQLIKAALEEGCRKFLLCLGGSATTDCGCGMAAALGVKFLDKDGNTFVPVGRTLTEISEIQIKDIDARISESEFTVMSDVESPLYGQMGAAYVFAPQKGANEEDVRLLDEGLRYISTLIRETTGTDYSMVKGSGAAGGTGCGCFAFLKAKTESGIEAMLRITDFDNKLEDCVLIVTGEGKVDRQSLMGKVLSGIKKHAGNIPIVTFCGICELTDRELADNKIYAVEIGKNKELQDSLSNGKKYLREKAKIFLSKDFL